MSLALTEIALVAQAILDRLTHEATQWTVTHVAPEQETEFAVNLEVLRDDLEVPRSILVQAAKVADPASTINSYFVLGIPAQQAIAQLASSLQDEVIETIRTAVPPCPAHSHPLSPRIDAGLAVWTCSFGIGPHYPISDIGQAAR